MFIGCSVPTMSVSDSVYNKTILLQVFSFSENQVVFTNSVDPDEISHYAEFPWALHCLQKYVLRSHQTVD